MTVDRTIAEDLAALRTIDEREVLPLEAVRALVPAAAPKRVAVGHHAGALFAGLASLAATVALFVGSWIDHQTLPIEDGVYWSWEGFCGKTALIIAAGYVLGRRIRTRFDTLTLACAIGGASALILTLGKVLLVGRCWFDSSLRVIFLGTVEAGVVAMTLALAWWFACKVRRGWLRFPIAVVAAGLLMIIATLTLAARYDSDEVGYGGADLAGQHPSQALHIALTATGAIAVVLVVAGIVALIWKRVPRR